MRSSRAPRIWSHQPFPNTRKAKCMPVLLRVEEEEQARGENKEIWVTVPPSLVNYPITGAVSNMGRLGKGERSSIQRLFNNAYLIAFKGRPYCDLTDIIELEKLYEVKSSQFCIRKRDGLQSIHPLCSRSSRRKRSFNIFKKMKLRKQILPQRWRTEQRMLPSSKRKLCSYYLLIQTSLRLPWNSSG